MNDIIKEPKGILIHEVLTLLNQKWISALDIEKIPQKLGVINDELLHTKIFIINQILEFYRKVPEVYFRDDDHRENIIDAIQETLDDLIEAEEQSFEEEEGEEDDDLDFNF